MSFTWECIYWWIDWLIDWLIGLWNWSVVQNERLLLALVFKTCNLTLFTVWYNGGLTVIFFFCSFLFCFFGFFCLCFFFESYKRIIKNGRGTTWFTLPISGIFFKFPDYRIRRKRYRGSWQGSSLPTLSLSTAQLHRRFHWICFQRNWTHQKLPKSTSRN